MRGPKVFILFFLFVAVVFFSTEFILDVVFEDKTPLWKIVAISLISALGLVWPFVKRKDEFAFADIIKRQNRTINFADTPAPPIDKIVEWGKENGFKRIKVNGNTISYTTRLSFKTFGERYKLHRTENQITIHSFSRYYFDMLDLGVAKSRIDHMEKSIKEL